jgi:hypothetical protein
MPSRTASYIVIPAFGNEAIINLQLQRDTNFDLSLSPAACSFLPACHKKGRRMYMSTLLQYVRTTIIFGLLAYLLMQAYFRSAFSIFRPAYSNPKMPDFLTATASDLQQLLTAKEVRSVDLVEGYFDHIHKHNGYLKALITHPPRSWLLETAKRLDDERSAGQVRGPFHGIPVLLKVGTLSPSSRGEQSTNFVGQYGHPQGHGNGHYSG